mmetsp:Transcript_1394/g.4442  ORF Transcript_1394/g.4442 Transcript_1394/m.4442 type:complete len:363 (+) Transcript_1394:1218-2306(+)
MALTRLRGGVAGKCALCSAWGVMDRFRARTAAGLCGMGLGAPAAALMRPSTSSWVSLTCSGKSGRKRRACCFTLVLRRSRGMMAAAAEGCSARGGRSACIWSRRTTTWPTGRASCLRESQLGFSNTSSTTSQSSSASEWTERCTASSQVAKGPRVRTSRVMPRGSSTVSSLWPCGACFLTHMRTRRRRGLVSSTLAMRVWRLLSPAPPRPLPAREARGASAPTRSVRLSTMTCTSDTMHSLRGRSARCRCEPSTAASPNPSPPPRPSPPTRKLRAGRMATRRSPSAEEPWRKANCVVESTLSSSLEKAPSAEPTGMVMRPTAPRARPLVQPRRPSSWAPCHGLTTMPVTPLYTPWPRICVHM